MIAGLIALAMAPSNAIPPPLYFGDNFGAVVFVTDPETACGITPDPGHRVIACADTANGRRVMILPNPCRFAPYEYYARIACHELGHWNGWKH